MTDNESINALECCHGEYSPDCENCPNEKTCKEIDSVIALINRQRAENENLKVDLAKCSIRLDNLYKTADEIKSEAIKEFVVRLKENVHHTDSWGNIVTMDAIDNLVKEMTEGEK